MAVTANYETVMVVSLKNGEENVQKVERNSRLSSKTMPL